MSSRLRLLPNDAAGGVLMKYTAITVRPDQMGGVPCIRGLRIPVATVVEMIAQGMSEKEILEAFPDLEKEDIRQALLFVYTEGDK